MPNTVLHSLTQRNEVRNKSYGSRSVLFVGYNGLGHPAETMRLRTIVPALHL